MSQPPQGPQQGYGQQPGGYPQQGGYDPYGQQGGYPGGGMPMQGGPARNARLVSNDGRTYPLSVGSTVIGRGDQANLRLPDVGISRRHARLDFDGAQVVLTDLGSTNGTMVNGQRVSAVALNPGDMIQIGTTTLTFRVDG